MTTNSPDEIGVHAIIKKNQNLRLNDIAWWERKNKQEVIQEAIDLYLETKKEVPVKYGN